MTTQDDGAREIRGRLYQARARLRDLEKQPMNRITAHAIGEARNEVARLERREKELTR